MRYSKVTTRGFTLLELIVVIAIIGALSVIVLPSFAKVLSNSRIKRANLEMEEIVKSIVIAQNQSGKTMTAMGVGCNDCSCRSGNIKNDTGACYTDSLSALTILESNTSGFVSGLSRMVRDPWGSPYCFDANQGESGPASCTTVDGFRSVGPDGAYGTADDIVVDVPLASKCP
jgi:prepilin-type N-terminal cleavage/methylation domain-containing protein